MEEATNFLSRFLGYLVMSECFGILRQLFVVVSEYIGFIEKMWHLFMNLLKFIQNIYWFYLVFVLVYESHQLWHHIVYIGRNDEVD